MNQASLVKEFKRKIRRYLVTYQMLLWPKAEGRNELLTSDYHRGMSPFWFFGITTSIAAAGYNLVARYKIEEIDLKPRWWQTPFELDFLGVSLKNACVEFMNAIIVAGVAMVVIRLVRQQISYRRCVAAFLFAYAIAILQDTVWHFLSNAYFTADEIAVPTTREWTHESGSSTNVTTNFARQAFNGDRLFVSVPTYFDSMFNNGSLYFIPKIVSLFNAQGIYLNYFSTWHESIFIIAIADWKIVLAAYILRLRILVGIAVVVSCSFIGYYVDAVVSRYTAKHTQMAYLSTRMHPSVQVAQAFKYSTTYFDNFPMKTGDLALIDFWQCKWSRHPNNKYFIDGNTYVSQNSRHFQFTYTRCDNAIPSVATFLAPEYEIVRVVAVANQAVELTMKGEFLVDAKPIADLVYEDDAEFKFTLPRRTEVQSSGLSSQSKIEFVEIPVKGKHFGYQYRRIRLPHEPEMAAYLWACQLWECTDDKLTDANFMVPDGYFLAMFDFMARPRLMMIKEKDLIGYPFVKAKKRW